MLGNILRLTAAPAKVACTLPASRLPLAAPHIRSIALLSASACHAKKTEKEPPVPGAPPAAGKPKDKTTAADPSSSDPSSAASSAAAAPAPSPASATAAQQTPKRYPYDYHQSDSPAVRRKFEEEHATAQADIQSETTIQIVFGDGSRKVFHNIWLRDHCRCEKCFNAVTRQRLIDTFMLPPNPKPVHVTAAKGKLTVKWGEVSKKDMEGWKKNPFAGSFDWLKAGGATEQSSSAEPVDPAHASHESVYDLQWLKLNSYTPPQRPPAYIDSKVRRLWDAKASVEDMTTSYTAAMASDAGVFAVLQKLQQYGVSFVQGLPASKAATEELCRRIAFIRETNFGGMWEFSPNLEFQDTAYTNVALKAHTDNTYYTDPCGVQVLHCIEYNGQIGFNTFVDGFSVASQLKKVSPVAFQFLSDNPISAQYIDDHSKYYAHAPIITVHPASKEVLQIRFNNDDRAPLSSLPADSVPLFYSSLRAWLQVLRNPKNEMRVKLEPGTMVLFDNHRVLHGRESFQGFRKVVGCYFGRDDVLSRYHTLHEKYA